MSAVEAAAQAFMQSPGSQRDLRDSDGFCLACESWTDHEDDCSFVALRESVTEVGGST